MGPKTQNIPTNPKYFDIEILPNIQNIINDFISPGHSQIFPDVQNIQTIQKSKLKKHISLVTFVGAAPHGPGLGGPGQPFVALRAGPGRARAQKTYVYNVVGLLQFCV